MTQIATVEKLLQGGLAEIAVPRKSACGHDCEECAGCGVSGTFVCAVAENPVGAQVGQKVIIESSSRKLFSVILLVYMLPVVLFFLGYFCSFGVNSEPFRCAIAIASFFIGIVPAIIYDRYLKKHGGLQFTIVRLL